MRFVLDMIARPCRARYRHWIFKLPLVRRYRGIVLGRTILFRDRETEIPLSLLQHELVHLEQIDRVGVARFYLIYLHDYLANLRCFRNHDAAYRNIPFEKEAYEREGRGAYLGREAEWARLDADIIAAGREGRVVGTVDVPGHVSRLSVKGECRAWP
jgi:hypothetical protein